MNDKINILVLGVGGNVSIGILKSIINSDIDAYTFGACVQKYAAGFAFCDESLLCPYANQKSFLPWLKKVIEDNEIKVVLSGVEEINNALAIANFENKKCQILVPEKHNLDIFNNKQSTVNWLAANNIAYPKTLDLGDFYTFSQIKSALTLPFVVKPKVGKGSSGVLFIESEEQYLNIKDKNLFIAQQLIGDAEVEYTCGIYKSIFNYTEILVMRRLLRNGSTIMAEVVDNQEIYNYCKKIADACNTSVPFNVQLRLCKKTQKPFCFEINMRLSGTTAIRHGFGFKDCQVWIKEVVQNKNYRSDFNVKPAVAMRYEAEVFFDKATLESLQFGKPTVMAID